MTPDSSHPLSPAGRASQIAAPHTHRRHPHRSALPLLATMSAALILAIVIIVSTAAGMPGSQEVAAVLVS